jgi:hypothetical protein
METNQIIHTVSSIFNGADERNWSKVQNAMANTVELDYSSLSGAPASTMLASQIVETWKAFLPGFDKTHHQLSNFNVIQQKDKVVVTFNGKADHFLKSEVWTAEGNYYAELIPGVHGWVVTLLRFNLTRQSGNTNLPAIAVQRIKNQMQA